MKIAIFGDMHWCVRNGSKIFNDYFIKCHQEFYFKELKKHGITQILQLGDLFDNRKHTSNYILKEAKEKYFNILEKEGYTFHTLAGNHDLYWRESLDVVTQDLVLGEYSNVNIYSTPEKLIIGNTSIDIIPWICDENRESVFNFIKESKSDICVGHFEFSGFSMYKGHETKEGLDHNIFEKYELVLSGHYHTKSQKNNIVYTGVPYEMTWSDYGDTKGYHIFDTETRKLEFIENPFRIFYRIEYNDTDIKSIKFKELEGKYVRLVVNKKTDLYNYDKFLEKLFSSNPIEIKIIEDNSDLQDSSIDENLNLEDSVSIMNSYVDNLEITSDKQKLKDYLKMLYNEAINLNV